MSLVQYMKNNFRLLTSIGKYSNVYKPRFRRQISSEVQQSEVSDEEFHHIYSSSNSEVKRLVRLRTHRKARQEYHAVVVSGYKIIKDIFQLEKIQHKKKDEWNHSEKSIPSPLHAISVWATPTTMHIRLMEFLMRKGLAERCYTTTGDVIAKVSGVKEEHGTRVGIIAELPILSIAPAWKRVTRLLVIDEISDPGNLGTILRTALALGFEAVFVLQGSCDIYNDKAVTAARGATFFLPIQVGTLSDLTEIFKSHPFQVFIAQSDPLPGTDGPKISPRSSLHFASSSGVAFEPSFHPSTPVALILGNESRGANILEYQKALGKSSINKVWIPTPHSPIESLNVACAASILLHYFQPQKL